MADEVRRWVPTSDWPSMREDEHGNFVLYDHLTACRAQLAAAEAKLDAAREATEAAARFVAFNAAHAAGAPWWGVDSEEGLLCMGCKGDDEMDGDGDGDWTKVRHDTDCAALALDAALAALAPDAPAPAPAAGGVSPERAEMQRQINAWGAEVRAMRGEVGG